MLTILSFWAFTAISFKTWITWILFLTVLQGWCGSCFIFTHWSWLVTAKYSALYTKCSAASLVWQCYQCCLVIAATIITPDTDHWGPGWLAGILISHHPSQETQAVARARAGVALFILDWNSRLWGVRIVDFWFELRISAAPLSAPCVTQHPSLLRQMTLADNKADSSFLWAQGRMFETVHTELSAAR